MRRLACPLMLTPALGIVTVLLLVPLLLLFAVSFWTVKSFRLVPGFSLDAWMRFFETYGNLTLYTVLVGLMAATFCVALGTAVAYALRFRAGRAADAFVLATLITLFGGYLVKIYAWKTILGADGIINSTLMGLGLTEAPLSWLVYNRGAVVLALVHFLLPFAILPIYAAMRNVTDASVESARDLGASPRTAFWRVVLPQCRGGIIAAFAFAFLLSAGDYVTPQFLGGSAGSMLGQFIALEFSTRFNWPAGAAASFGLLAASAIVLGLLSALAARIIR